MSLYDSFINIPRPELSYRIQQWENEFDENDIESPNRNNFSQKDLEEDENDDRK